MMSVVRCLSERADAIIMHAESTHHYSSLALVFSQARAEQDYKAIVLCCRTTSTSHKLPISHFTAPFPLSVSPLFFFFSPFCFFSYLVVNTASFTFQSGLPSFDFNPHLSLTLSLSLSLVLRRKVLSRGNNTDRVGYTRQGLQLAKLFREALLPDKHAQLSIPLVNAVFRLRPLRTRARLARSHVVR